MDRRPHEPQDGERLDAYVNRQRPASAPKVEGVPAFLTPADEGVGWEVDGWRVLVLGLGQGPGEVSLVWEPSWSDWWYFMDRGGKRGVEGNENWAGPWVPVGPEPATRRSARKTGKRDACKRPGCPVGDGYCDDCAGQERPYEAATHEARKTSGRAVARSREGQR